jgi:hypothetical protein
MPKMDLEIGHDHFLSSYFQSNLHNKRDSPINSAADPAMLSTTEDNNNNNNKSAS